MSSNKKNTLIIIGLILFWLLVSGGVSWWLWTTYQQLDQPDKAQLQAKTVQLDVDTLNQAVEGLGP